jgi:hypothetical protein
MGRRTAKVYKPTGVAGAEAIVRMAGSHDTLMHRKPFTGRISRTCTKCGAPIGSRCLDLDALPTKVWLRGFHRGR